MLLRSMIFLIYLIVFCGLASRLIAQPIITLPALDDRAVALGLEWEYLCDESGTKSINDIVHERGFTRLGKALQTLGRSKDVHWYRFRLSKQYPTSQSSALGEASAGAMRHQLPEKVLFLGVAGIDTALLFVPRRESLQRDGFHSGNSLRLVQYDTLKSGEKVRLQGRAIRSKLVVLPLPMPQDSLQTYFLKVTTSVGDTLESTILSLHTFQERQRNIGLMVGIMLGIMGFAVLYNLILFVTTRDTVYIPYILYVFFFALAIIQSNFTGEGTFTEWLIPAKIHIRTFLVCVIAISSTQFTRMLLQMRSAFPKGDILLRAYIVSQILVYCLTVFEKQEVASLFSQYSTFYALCVTLVIFALQWKHTRQLYLRMYMVSYLFFTLSTVIIFSFRLRLVNPTDTGLGYYLAFGSIGLAACVEIILFSFTLVVRINDLRERLLQEREYRLQAEQDNERERLRTLEAMYAAQAAELAALRYQINPHFLFNALSSLRGLVEEDAKRARTMIGKLSEYLRYTVYPVQNEHFSGQNIAQSQDLVSLREEIAMVRNYFDIEYIRFEEKLQVAYHIPPMLESILLPAFILQPLAENALKYGMQTSTMPLSITVTAEKLTEPHQSSLRLLVRNSGQIPSLPQDFTQQSGVGLRNVQERLRHFYDDRAQLELRQERKDGFSFVVAEIIVPLR